LNIKVSDETLLKTLTVEPSKSLLGKTILVEYSDPNPLKPLHAGHLYTTLVGDTLANIIENAGAKVLRINYGGDVGRHIGISLWAILRQLGGENPEKLTTVAESERPAWLGARYVEGTRAFEEDQLAKEQITSLNKRVYEIHADDDHDSPLAQIYWTTRTWSYDYFKVLYDQLQVHPFDRFIPESEVFQLGVTIIKEQLAKGIYKKSQGAVIFEGEPFGLHTRVFINSAGLPTYETKDVGLLFRKWEDYHFDESIVITANEQSQYYA
jgi:arginyl-tRNA synthetase